MIVGIAIGIVFMLCLIIAFAAGYGWDKNTTDEQEKF